MKKIYYLSLLLSILFIQIFGLNNAAAQTFTNGNLAVFVAASNSANNTTGSIIEINRTTVSQTAITTRSIEGLTLPDAMRFSGSATSSAYLTNSDDGTLLCLPGHNSNSTGVNANTITTRAVITYNNAGTFSKATTYTGTSGNQVRSATTVNNTNWFIGDQGGLYTNGSSSASINTNLRTVKPFGGTVYAMSSSTTTTLAIFATPTANAFTSIMSASTAPLDFYLISSGSNGITYDVLYFITGTNILKYSLVSGVWTANGSFTLLGGGFGICAKANGGGADLFITSGSGATSANSVIKFTDAAGFNATINLGSATTLYTTAATTTIKGIAFAPVSVASPAITGAATASAFTTTYGTASAVQTFSVSGTALTANLVATAPTGFAVSNDGISYGSTATFTQSSGSASGTLRIRLAATAAVGGSYNSQNIILSSTGATSVNITTTASGNTVKGIA